MGNQGKSDFRIEGDSAQITVPDEKNHGPDVKKKPLKWGEVWGKTGFKRTESQGGRRGGGPKTKGLLKMGGVVGKMPGPRKASRKKKRNPQRKKSRFIEKRIHLGKHLGVNS